jgi:hypothetical protein
VSRSAAGPGPARREYLGVLLVGALSAGLAVTAATGDRSWGTSTISAAGLPARTYVVTAGDAAPATGAAALVALAGLGAVLATAGRWRQAVGAVVLAAGLGVVAGAALAGPAVDDALRDEVAAAPGGNAPATADRALAALTGGGWRWAALAGGLGVTAVGAATVLRGHRWPAMGRRYQAPVPAPAGRPRDETDLWQALDRGHDPTGDPGTDDPAAPHR